MALKENEKKINALSGTQKKDVPLNWTSLPKNLNTSESHAKRFLMEKPT